MKRTDEMQGQRLPDMDYWNQHQARDDPPGSYRRLKNAPPEAFSYASNLTGTAWVVMTPNGLHGLLGAHTVREEADDSITVAPGDGSSNSILITDGEHSWHGYITKGLWWSLA